MTDTEKQKKYTGLKPWKPGESGNPKGRPKKDVSLTSLVKKYLDIVPDIQIGGKVNDKTWRQLIVQAWLIGSYKGNATLFKELLERIEGKVAQPITGAEGESLIPHALSLIFPDGTQVVPGRMGGDGHKPLEVESSGDGHKD